MDTTPAPRLSPVPAGAFDPATETYHHPLDDRLLAELAPKPPQGSQASRYQTLTDAARAFMAMVLHLCPPSPQKRLAITRIKEAKMWAVDAIAQAEP